jgi:ankyrin repeat protein
MNPPLLAPTRTARTAAAMCLALCLALCLATPVPPAAAQAASAPLGLAELPIHDAARTGTQQHVQRLLQAAPAQRDARTPLGATPLHYAAINADTGPLQALLAAGANPNARDHEGRTPLHMAAFATRTAQARLLLRAGADPLLKTEAGRDVLSLARRVRADELAGEVSLWILKGCTVAKPC